MSSWDQRFTPNFGDLITAPQPVESADGTLILNPTDPAIIDASGETIKLLTVNGQISVNGVADPTTAHVTEIVYSQHLVFVLSNTGLWYSRSRMGNPWQAANSPLGAAKVTHATVQAEIDALVATLAANQTAVQAALAKIRLDVGKLTP